MLTMRFRAVAAVGVLAAVAAPFLVSGSASAAVGGSARVTGDRVQFTAAKGHANRIVVTRSGSAFVLDDVVAIRGTAGCVRVGSDKTKVRCAAKNRLVSVILDLGDRNDTATNKSNFAMDVRGGAGNDVLNGGDGGDSLDGGAGNDRLSGRGGADGLVDGPGNDWLDGSAGDDSLNTAQGADTLIGGAGNADLVYYGSRTRPLVVDLDGAKRDDGEKGEADTVGTDVEIVIGGSGNDVLTGNSRANKLTGGRGNDVIRGGGGSDFIVGNNGNDKIYGGAGNDHLIGENTTDRHPDGTPPSSDAAKDHVDGGSHAANWGDFCTVRKAGKTVNCELFD